ncbi:MAG: 30S ribosomal protein S20 [Myxococcota bacterium]|nr:30S ribosomal protein S20 [Myxococcota bacterium]MEC8425651.1 30S ribosomal protein S20 [Myxococcota bacterium]
MANHKDALKRIRQNEVRRQRNKHYRSMMRTEIKKLNKAIDAGDSAAAQAQLPKTVSLIQRVAQKGIIHRKQAARRVSRLSVAVNKTAKS